MPSRLHIIALLAATLLAMCVIAWLQPAGAMGWYDPACCSNHDCEQISDTAVTLEAGGYHVRYLAALGFEVDVIVPFNEAKPSRDEHYHGCATSDRFLCLYVPAST